MKAWNYWGELYSNITCILLQSSYTKNFTLAAVLLTAVSRLVDTYRQRSCFARDQEPPAGQLLGLLGYSCSVTHADKYTLHNHRCIKILLI